MVWIPLLISVLGIGCVCLLWRETVSARRHLKLARHRSGEPAFADLLIYAALAEDGVVLGKDGSLLASWLVRGPDASSITDAERERLSAHINQALSHLGSGWMMHVDAVRRACPAYPDPSLSHFPDRVSAAIDMERRRLFESLGAMYEGYVILTLTWLPPVLLERRLVDLMFDDDGPESLSPKDSTRALLAQFQREIQVIESRLSLSFELDRLCAEPPEEARGAVRDALLGHLNRCITGLNHPVVRPQDPMYLDAVLGGQELWTGIVPRVGRLYVQVVAIEGFPSESSAGMLTALADLACEYRWSTRFIYLDPNDARSRLEKYRKFWRQKIRGFWDQVLGTQSGPVDRDAVSMVDDAEAALADVSSSEVAMGYYTSVIVLMDEDRETVERQARQFDRAIQRLGFSARIETINTMDAYLGSLPGHGVENVRRPLLSTQNLADLLPTSSIWTGRASAPCPMYPANAPPLMECVTGGSTPFHFNVHAGSDLGHTLMFGPPGSGKSTHLSLLAAQFRRYAGVTINVFDVGLSMYPLAKAMGGAHFELCADSPLSFSPLQFLDTPGDRTWAAEWIESILVLNGLAVNAGHRHHLAHAIRSMHESGSRTFSEFLLTVQDAEIRQVLEPYSVDGLLGHLLDAKEDALRLSSFNVFELGELLALGDRAALPVMLYLFRRIERQLQGQPSVILIDEAWVLLGNPAFREKLREWLKTMRKHNCAVILATQSLSDAHRSGILDVLIEATATKIFLPNAHARDPEPARLYRGMGLNDAELGILAGAVQKRDYYYFSEEGRRVYELALGPLALALAGSWTKEVRACIERCEGDWVESWLREHGLRLEEYEGEAA